MTRKELIDVLSERQNLLVFVLYERIYVLGREKDVLHFANENLFPSRMKRSKKDGILYLEI